MPRTKLPVLRKVLCIGALLAVALWAGLAAGQTISINEYMAINNTTNILDDDFEANGWLELYNASAVATNLDGLYLTNTTPFATKGWRIPAVSVPPHGFLLIWASSKNR